MRAGQAGDSDAYLQLLQRITPRIRQIVGRRRGFVGAADVDDLVQDILLSLHTVRSTYDPNRPFMPWLLAIIRNRLADGARRYARQRAREVHVGDPAVTFAEKPANIDDESFENREALEHAIRALPKAQRLAIELLKLKELSFREAATTSGLSIGALKVATHRAIVALRRTLNRTESHEN
jgi:RNA polymerase sigma-70 factor (ECF subfamily)